MKTRVGVQALGVAVPRRYVDMADLAVARGVDPAKYLQGLGAQQMAVADASEDTVALAATAGQRALAAAGVDGGKLGLLVVGTETGVDHSKPVASFVQGLLGLPRAMRVYDTQHACYGGTAGLMAAAEWIASGAAAGRSALVICSDIARYGLKTAGEPTQGAGAVALLVSEQPDVLELDFGLSGAFSAHVHDFWRPLGQREAQVDGHYSVKCYLEALAGAYADWKARALTREALAPGRAGLPSEQLARICYHVPFCKMARKAHLQVRRVDLEASGVTYDAAVEAREAQEGLASFEAQVAPSLSVCARVGNVYTGSLYLSLAGLLHAQAAELAGKRVGLFSYGSGCTSEFFSGVVGAKAAQRLAALELGRLLDARERVSVEEYERVLGQDASALPLPRASGGFQFAGVKAHQRQYVGAGA